MTFSALCELRVLRGEKMQQKGQNSYYTLNRLINLYSFNFSLAEFGHGFCRNGEAVT
jgi:hypothetical protein